MPIHTNKRYLELRAQRKESQDRLDARAQGFSIKGFHYTVDQAFVDLFQIFEDSVRGTSQDIEASARKQSLFE